MGRLRVPVLQRNPARVQVSESVDAFIGMAVERYVRDTVHAGLFCLRLGVWNNIGLLGKAPFFSKVYAVRAR